MEALIHDPTFWVAVAFVGFILLVRKPVGKAVSGALDKRSAQIRDELDEAVRLREEAQLMLLAYQKKQREYLQEAEEILSQTREDAERMMQQAEADLQDSLEKRKRLGMEKIAQAERQAVQDVQNHMVDIAAAAARTIIERQIVAGSDNDLVTSAISEIERKLH